MVSKVVENKGFTLIELLVVIAIISLLSSIVISSVKTARVKARLVAVQQSLSTLRTQAELFRSDNNGVYNDSDSSYYNETCFSKDSGIEFYDDDKITSIIYEITKITKGHDPQGNGDYITCTVGRDYFKITLDMWDIGGRTSSICMSSEGGAYKNISFDEYSIENCI